MLMEETRCLADFLSHIVPAHLWAYNGPMEIVNYPEHSYMQIGASGNCPHCANMSGFDPIATHQDTPYHRLVSAVRCRTCKGYGVVVGIRKGTQEWHLVNFYPLGNVNDAVDNNVPSEIAADFREALRCHWAKAYKAAVVMCRRAVQASALALGASKGKKLDKQIDWLAEKGKITEPLRELAHEVRLVGNEGAHPDKDNLKDVTPDDADDIISFTRQYFLHVYVMPALLAARKQQKSVPVAPTTPTTP